MPLIRKFLNGLLHWWGIVITTHEYWVYWIVPNECTSDFLSLLAYQAVQNVLLWNFQDLKLRYFAFDIGNFIKNRTGKSIRYWVLHPGHLFGTIWYVNIYSSAVMAEAELRLGGKPCEATTFWKSQRFVVLFPGLTICKFGHQHFLRFPCNYLLACDKSTGYGQRMHHSCKKIV